MRKHKGARYRVIAKNRPGELARLAALLASEGVPLERLTVASLGEDEAAIDITAPPLSRLPERLARCGLRPA